MKSLRAFLWLWGSGLLGASGTLACSSEGGDDSAPGGEAGATGSSTAGEGGTGNDSGNEGGSGNPDDIDPSQSVDEQVSAFLKLGLEDQEALVSERAAQVERELFTVSGLEEALGGAESTDVEWASNLEGLAAVIAELREQEPRFEAEAKWRTAATSFGEGLAAALFGGYLGSALGGQAALLASNDGSSGSFGSGPFKMTAAVDQATMTLTASETSSEGLTTEIESITDLHPCPNQNGTFLGSAHLHMSSAGGGAAQSGALSVRITGHVDDDANVAGVELDIDFLFGNSGKGSSEFLDYSLRVGVMGSDTPTSAMLNHQSDNISATFAQQSASLGVLMGVMIGTQLTGFMKEALQSGRCVRLDTETAPADRTGVEPGTEFAVSARPRSKLDGTATGGSVVATLVDGAAVEPSGTKVPADADFTYTAPGEASQHGGVNLEARSKRGVGKASLTFDTGGGYTASGGGNGVTITGTVADITRPFMLDGTLDGGSIVLTYLPDTEDGRSGTVTYTGSGGGFSLNGEGTYVITGEAGGPLTLTQDVGGCVDEHCGDGTEVITLTPIE